MQALLTAFGIAATVVSSEAQAHEALQQAGAHGQPIPVLLFDWRLAEGADGLAAAQRLKAQQQAEGLSVIMITGETDPARLQRLRDSELPVLFKPVMAHTLLRALAERLMDSESGLPPSA